MLALERQEARASCVRVLLTAALLPAARAYFFRLLSRRVRLVLCVALLQIVSETAVSSPLAPPPFFFSRKICQGAVLCVQMNKFSSSSGTLCVSLLLVYVCMPGHTFDVELFRRPECCLMCETWEWQ